MALKKKFLIFALIVIMVAGGWYLFAAFSNQPINESPDIQQQNKVPDSESLHTFQFTGRVLLGSNSDISQVEQESKQESTGLFNGHRGRISLKNGTCKLIKDYSYEFVVQYDEALSQYECMKARALGERGSYGF